mgnify:CR=1 FL=1
MNIEELQKENDYLRASLANGNGPCVYCNLPKSEWGKCTSGFPGCGRADDASLCPHFGAQLMYAQYEDPRLLDEDLISRFTTKKDDVFVVKEDACVFCSNDEWFFKVKETIIPMNTIGKFWLICKLYDIVPDEKPIEFIF